MCHFLGPLAHAPSKSAVDYTMIPNRQEQPTMTQKTSTITSCSARNTAAALLVAALLATTAQAASNEVVVQTAGNVPYVSGGIGSTP
jgi:mannose-1-phosphate guanylyltransferase